MRLAFGLRLAVALAFGALCAPAIGVIAHADGPREQATQAVGSARALKSAGRATEALALVDGVLSKEPANVDAARMRIEILMEQDQLGEALTSYDRYVEALRRPDTTALAIVARADLARSLVSMRDQPMLVARVLERLAGDGNNEALQALEVASTSSAAISPEGLAPTISLARLKNQAAETRLGDLVRSAAPDARAQAIQAIGEAGARSQIPRVIDALSDAEPNVRSAAAITLGTLGAREAVPQLQTAFETDAYAVRMFAAVALRQLGQGSVDEFLDGLLSGPIAELRVIAAGAYRSVATKSPRWEKAVRELLASPNELHRVQAAELLACCDPAAARNVLTSALASGNPLLRQAAAKALEARPELADASIARRVMGDAKEGIRVYGAGLALTLAKRAGSTVPREPAPEP